MGPMRHAVVIGASIGGLCAAKVLAEFADQVTVFERDELPAEPASRSATPQDRHVHLLMARGAEELESLFPGLLADMVADGVPILENRPDCIHFGAAGHVLGTQHRLQDEFTAYVPSRPHLEWQIRSRVTALPNVTLQRRGVDEGDEAQLQLARHAPLPSPPFSTPAKARRSAATAPSGRPVSMDSLRSIR